MDIINLLKEKYSTMTTKQKKLADFMIKDPHIMCFITLKELSAETKITEVTILNACMSLGFNNFNELKYEFRKYNNIIQKKEVQLQNLYSNEPVPSYELTHKEQLLIDICHEEFGQISNFVSNVDISRIFTAADIMIKFKTVVICGRGISYQLAEFLATRLIILGISPILVNTELSDSVYGALSFLNEDMLMIPISFPDYYYMTNKFVEYAKIKRTTIISITDDEKSKVGLNSDLVLTCPSSTRLFLNTLAAPMMLCNLLTSAVSIVYSAKNNKTVSSIEEFTKIFKENEKDFLN